MTPASKYDVIIVGAGAAGLTAAIGLARADFRVAVLEAGPYPGAENWSGCVYFCENLARPEILGPEGVEALAWERRLVQRGLFATDGYGLLGFTYRDPEAFRHCYTVLRPIYDHHLAQYAQRWGALILTRTTVLSLIRDQGRVVGVSTNRGPLYADLVFLAEGDAAHLVSREGYLSPGAARQSGRFFQGIKLVLELPPGALEERFGLGAEEGAAYEFLLRNGTLDGRPLHLNLGGFLYTNRQSLSLGLVVAVEHLQEHFGGDPYLLLDWFANLPALAPWLAGARRGAFGAKLIHHCGRQELPRLVDNGLAIGGAASGLGIDFPYPNFTGPATAMGWQLVQAACRIRAAGVAFDRAALEQHYLQPLQRSHYWQDFEFLRGWPAYLHKTRVFFDQQLDLLLGSTYLWTRSDRWWVSRWWSWLRLCRRLAGPAQWPELRADLHQLYRAVQLGRILPRPALGQLLLDGALNACRDLIRKPRAHLPSAGQLRVHYQVGGGREPAGLPPASWRRWFARFAPVFACAARLVYSNQPLPVESKLRQALQLLWKQINIVDVFGFFFFALGSALLGLFQALGERLWRRRQPVEEPARPDRVNEYLATAQRAADLTPRLPGARQTWDAQLARLRYETVKTSHIHVLWPQQLAEKDAVVQAGLWHVCPAHVYDYRRSADGRVQVLVNFENCIKCETCWRASDLVDWGRDGGQRFAYAVYSPQVVRLLAHQDEVPLVYPHNPRQQDWWAAFLPALPAPGTTPAPREAAFLSELYYLCNALDRKLDELAEALAAEPRTVDRARSEFLTLLARYTHQLALRLRDLVREGPWPAGAGAGADLVRSQALQLARALAAKAEEQARHAWEQRLAWAVGDGWHLRHHHLAGLRRCLEWFCPATALPAYQPAAAHWQQAMQQLAEADQKAAPWRQQLDALFPPGSWRLHESGAPLTAAQDQLLRQLLAQVPVLEEQELEDRSHPPFRKWLLAELGRRDPALAYRTASHLWARDLAYLAPADSELGGAARRWAAGERWACLAGVSAEGVSWLTPAGAVEDLLLRRGQHLVLLRARSPQVDLEPLVTLGLRSAGLCRLQVAEALWHKASCVPADQAEQRTACLCAADLIALAFGMSDRLCQRAVEHAAQRVQFPGLFLDEEGRDAIGKFGAVKKLLAELAVRRLVLETLVLMPGLTTPSTTGIPLVVLLSALGRELLGTAPGSVTYNAGQIFGGTGYSEDDILSKYYRDSATLRFVAESPAAVFLAQGRQLLADWEGQGHQLSSWPQEAQLFEELVQRKALQAELDEIRVQRSRLRRLVGEWRSRVPAGAEVAGAELAETLGRLDAWLLASKALLLRLHAQLEAGLTSEVELALLRVWLENLADRLDDLEDLVQRQQALGRSLSAARPVVDPAAGPPLRRYADFLAADLTCDTGDFLCRPTEPLTPRYVPEMVDSDPELAARQREIRDLFQSQFGAPRDGLSYERWIEQQHRPAAADLEFLREHGYLRFPIPQELGGEGRRKAEYYLLTTTAQRLADVAISLTIQVNSSLGTTPILLARDKDLPRAQQEVGGFVAEPARAEDIRQRLRKLQGSWETTPRRLLTASVQELQERLEELFRQRPVLRSLAGPFLDRWQRVRQAVERAPAAVEMLPPLLAAWEEFCQQAASLAEELGRRRQACDLFLRWIAAGQISAFALTEPSAGSDTARLLTRARLRSVPVEVEPDGALRFIPFGEKEPRYLLDASRLEFRRTVLQGRPQLRAFYRWSDHAEPALIHFEEYDYETDQGRRYYEHGGRRIYFTDIAQLRSRQGQLWYDYWELTGAKMWITNGRICGVLCLYARTEAGVTGFLVDRHAEGLVVGKDEAKMGQCGSPTNELSLQAVRVPRENVLGLEGRGQANALETLNAGRVGLAQSAMCQMRWLLEVCRQHGQRCAASDPSSEKSAASPPPWAAWRLQRLEEDCFLAEALAYDLVGRLEHPGTRSLRLESASGKFLNSELWLSMLETAEELFGPEGQTTRHLLEKRKRDARVLTIYEGTNEVQRFLILRELVNEVAPRLATPAPSPADTNYFSSEIVETDALKEQLRQQLQTAYQTFGAQLWQNPNFQANCFLLAEAAAWLVAAESTLGRLAWLSRQLPCAEDSDLPEALSCGLRAWQRCTQEVRRRLRRFAEELTHLRRGYYAPAVRAAALLLRARMASTPPAIPDSRLTRPFSILVVLEAPLAPLPEIHTADGRLQEHDLQWRDSEQAALEMALRLRESATAPCRLEVVCVAPRRALPLLREVAALGVDRVCLLVPPDAEMVSADQAAAALRTLWPTAPSFDLVLGGSGAGEEGLVGPLLAAAWGIPYIGTAPALVVRTADEEPLQLWPARQEQGYRLPAAVTLESDLSLRLFTLAGYFAGLEKGVEVHSWPASLPATPLFLEAAAVAPPPASGGAAPPTPLSPWQAAQLVMEILNIGKSLSPRSSLSASAPARKLHWERGRQPLFLEATGACWVLAVLAAETGGDLSPLAERVLQAAALLAQSTPAARVGALLLTGPTAEEQQQAAAALAALASVPAVLVPLPARAAGEPHPLDTPAARAALLHALWPRLETAPLAVVAEPWAEPALLTLGAPALPADRLLLRVADVERQQGQLFVETARFGGRLRCRQPLTLQPGATCWLTLTRDGQVGAVTLPQGETARIQVWEVDWSPLLAQPPLQQLLARTRRTVSRPTRLVEADCILDLGAGIGNRDGYETVIVPLEETLRQLGVERLALGGSRKVTEELHLLPAECQIGQSGVAVQPKVLLAIGLSGAPQHVNYIGPETIIIAFNRDAEAPLITLNQRQARPRVYPVLGDLFETVPAFTAALRQPRSAEPDWPHQEITHGV